jgi:hypothetical protein
MAIRKIGMLTEVTPGQYICIEPLMRDHICSSPLKVLRRSGKRVYFENRHGEEKFCAVGSVVALCDTQEEAAELFAISLSQFDRLREVRNEHKAQFAALLA